MDGLPPDVTRRLNEAFNAVMAQPSVRDKLLSGGLAPVGGTPDAFARFVGRRDREVDEDRARRRGACGLADYAMDGIRVADPLARTGVAVPPDQAWG